MERWALIYNPVSGSFRQEVLEELAEILTSEGKDPLLLPSERPGDIIRLAREVSGVQKVAVYGGDGSLSEAAQGMMERQLPLAVIPGGTGNSTAREIGLDLDPVQALRSLLNGSTMTFRPGKIDDRVFVNMAGIGFDGQVVHALSRGEKNALGAFSYITAGLRSVLRRHPGLSVTRPDGRSIKGIWVVAARTARYAGLLKIHPRAGLQEPALGLTCTNGWMLLPFGIGRLLLHLPVRGPGLCFESHPSWTVTSAEPVHVHIDGDWLKQGTMFNISLAPFELELCLPAD
ncbi:MAG: diacylglycerol kinase family protein [Deltaproteobacteria bacterium]|nr:diacylglycerol kinase family protein [Deltaproteobacteria bacterium]